MKPVYWKHQEYKNAEIRSYLMRLAKCIKVRINNIFRRLNIITRYKGKNFIRKNCFLKIGLKALATCALSSNHKLHKPTHIQTHMHALKQFYSTETCFQLYIQSSIKHCRCQLSFPPLLWNMLNITRLIDNTCFKNCVYASFTFAPTAKRPPTNNDNP